MAFEAAFVQVLMLAKETGLLAVGTVSIDGTKMDASASKIKTVRYDRAKPYASSWPQTSPLLLPRPKPLTPATRSTRKPCRARSSVETC